MKKKVKTTLSKLTFHKLDWLEWTTIGIGFWFVFFSKPYAILFTLLLIIPILGLVLNGLNGRPSIASLVEITKKDKGGNKYDVADFIDLAAIAILIRVLKDFAFESFYSLIIPGAITFSGMLIILFVTHKRIGETTKNKTWIYSSLLFNVFLYSYAATYGANCVYDTSEATVYEAKVIDKHTHRGRKGSRTYYVKVTPWGHHYDPENISVPYDQYERIQIDEKVKIDLQDGLFGIQWYHIE